MSSTFQSWHRMGTLARGGFALVITLSLMVLLTLLAVGLLGLSAVALRSSGRDEAMATARGNARLALLLALGELQKHAGMDQAITARADIIDSKIANPRLTGVWDSWEIKATAPPSASDYEKSARDAKFRGWLVSGNDPAATRKVGFASLSAASPVTLWGSGTLGRNLIAADRVAAARVPLTTGSQRGAVAWAVLDEGIKARINTPFVDEAASVAAKTLQLGSGERPGVEFLAGLKPLERRFFEKKSPQFAIIEKGISRLNSGLAGEHLAEGLREALRPLGHDLTTQSIGLFTDTAHGGLKQDMHLLTNPAALPADYRNKGVYVSRLGLTTANAPSDPSWAGLREFARLYRDKIANSSGVPVLKAQVPANWRAASGTTGAIVVNRVPPPGVVLMPTIAKVQMLFSLIGRDIYDYPPPAGNPIPASAAIIHQPQGGQFKGTRFEFDLHLLYTPVVTLHNPYNVAIELNTVRLEFIHVPFAMQIFRNGIAQSTGLVPLETMYADNERGQQGKVFGMNLKTKLNGKPGTTTFRLMPGEVKMFSPYIDPTRTYRQDLGSRQFWDIYVGTGITTNIDAIPGWRGDGIGYDCDWLAGSQKVNGDAADGHWASCLGLARDDAIHVLFAPLGIPVSNNKFVVQMSATVANSSTPAVVSAIEMNYETPTGLQKFILGNNPTLRYPKTGTVRGIDLVDHATTPIASIRNAKPFALLSAQAKSTSGGRDASNEDGRLATKPWCFAHPVIGGTTQKVVSEHSANFSHEIDLQLLEKGTANLLPVDLQDRTVFISGHTNFNGTKFGGLYDIPLAPLQSLASLNGANPGGASGFLPRFAQPIGNSWAHPLLRSTSVIDAKTGGNYLDHSFLLNLALYDSYYFSGLADQSGPFGSGRALDVLATEFAAGKPLDDPRLLLRPPDGKPAGELAKEVAKDTAHTTIAGWQLMVGAFNVNSTSVAAWQAMLTSVHDSQALFNQLNKSASSSKLTALPAPRTDHARISRFRLPAADSSPTGDPKDNYWLGAREYSATEVEKLAEHIVKQIRERGPFLSMAEFVNRRLGSDQTAQCGALQQAIDDSMLNQAPAIAANAGFEIPVAAVGTYKYANVAAGAGPSYQGAPGFLTQADLLNVLGNAATPRSDTFTIRGYGEARDAANQVLATATCEAVVQRVPDYLDPGDQVQVAPAALTSPINKTFGRRFLITSFRWLNPDEI